MAPLPPIESVKPESLKLWRTVPAKPSNDKSSSHTTSLPPVKNGFGVLPPITDNQLNLLSSTALYLRNALSILIW